MYRLHELLRAFGRHHGEMLNTSAVARTLATTRLQVGRYIRSLRSEGYLRLLPSLPQPRPSDMIRRPRLYLRARAFKHVFARVPAPGGCLRVPVQAELAARITDSVIERETSRRRSSGFHSMGRYRRRGLDLVVTRPSGWRIGFCFEPRAADPHSDKAVQALREALASGWIDAAILVTCSGFPGLGRRGVLFLPAPLLLAMYSQWTSEVKPSVDLAPLLEWIGEHREIVVCGVVSPDEPMALDGWYLPVEEEWLGPALLRPP